jgi:diguanylate cyclase (GGDEF)-like protein
MSEPLNILLVDDSEDDTFLLIRTLIKGGLSFHHVRVDNEPDMKKQLQEQAWDVIISDHNMPSFSSTDVMRIMKDYGVDIPIIIVSGMIPEDEAAKAMQGGVQDYIMKDNLVRLVPVIKRELKQASDRRARRIAEKSLAHLSDYDKLTGLMNRERFKVLLENTLSLAKTEKRRHGLLYLDLDQFKIINDSVSHDIGDEFLKGLTRSLNKSIRATDTLARLGGDEFGLLVENATLEGLTDIANNLLVYINNFKMAWQDKTLSTTASIGVVIIDDSIQDVDSLLSIADIACYAAKDKGRNSYQVFTHGDESVAESREQMNWATKVREALEKNLFVLFCQKVTPLAPNATGFNQEFLVRIKDNSDIIPPPDFIPAAERFNLMPLVDRWVIRHAFEYIDQALNAIAQETADCYFINLSGTSLSDEAFFSYLLARFRDHQIPAHRVCFEITETTAISKLEQASQFIREIKKEGFRIALDDFGVGMSSFGYLKSIPADVLKIDGSFVKNMATDKMDYAIVEACNSIAHTAGLRTVAESVEDETTLALLKRIGVDYAQGFVLHKPAPVFIPKLGWKDLD